MINDFDSTDNIRKEIARLRRIVWERARLDMSTDEKQHEAQVDQWYASASETLKSIDPGILNGTNARYGKVYGLNYGKGIRTPEGQRELIQKKDNAFLAELKIAAVEFNEDGTIKDVKGLLDA